MIWVKNFDRTSYSLEGSFNDTLRALIRLTVVFQTRNLTIVQK